MDFMSGLPRTPSNCDVVWVIVNGLTKSSHFIPMRMDYSMERLAKLYVERIVCLHGIPSSIVSDRYLSFTSRFWEGLQSDLGTNLRLSSSYHPQTDVSIRVLEWNCLKLCMVEGAGRLCEKVKAYQSRQKSYHDKRRKVLEFEVGDHVFLRVTPVTIVGRALKSLKLTSRFIGPYKILKRVGEVSYHIAMSLSLVNLHDVFHVPQLRRYIVDPSHVVQVDDVQVRDNLTMEKLPMRIEDQELEQLSGKDIGLMKIIWEGPASGKVTWELESKMRELYLELFV
ncbi:uncharacterized protein LOC131641352 [Vicia villosa]|uniref:uncharacterized protein LOC131641352 n=1 Tax=Vicia villosa TaxID=3911 RepID=UPI00273C4F30|nr:uncharacterized protein LOC131641352 [Vicia villosa]